MAHEKVKVPEDVQSLIKKSSMLAYLWHGCEEAVPYTLREDTRVSTHGSDIKGQFISCLVGSRVLPAGTEGWVYVSYKVSYSEYRRVFDEDYPAIGADIIHHGAYYTFVTVVELESGNKVIADSFKTVDYPEPRVVGKIQ